MFVAASSTEAERPPHRVGGGGNAAQLSVASSTSPMKATIGQVITRMTSRSESQLLVAAVGRRFLDVAAADAADEEDECCTSVHDLQQIWKEP